MTEPTKPGAAVKAVDVRRLVGSIEPYVLGDSFDVYLEGVDNFFELNCLTDDMFKLRLFINKVGAEASAKILKTVKPKALTEYKFAEIVQLCKALFGVERNSIV